MSAIELGSTNLFNDPNLTAYYKLENTSDSKGSNTLTNNAGVTFTAAQFNNGANLGTSNTNKSLTVSSALSVTNACSLTAWIKILTVPGTNVVYSLVGVSTSANSCVYSLEYADVATTKTIRATYLRPNVSETNSDASFDLGSSSFHQLVLTYDATNLRLYIDGALAAGPTAASGTGTGVGDVFAIGERADTYDGLNINISSALIDDIGVFNRVLTAFEIFNLYNGVVNSNLPILRTG